MAALEYLKLFVAEKSELLFRRQKVTAAIFDGQVDTISLAENWQLSDEDIKAVEELLTKRTQQLQQC